MYVSVNSKTGLHGRVWYQKFKRRKVYPYFVKYSPLTSEENFIENWWGHKVKIIIPPCRAISFSKIFIISNELSKFVGTKGGVIWKLEILLLFTMVAILQVWLSDLALHGHNNWKYSFEVVFYLVLVQPADLQVIVVNYCRKIGFGKTPFQLYLTLFNVSPLVILIIVY